MTILSSEIGFAKSRAPPELGLVPNVATKALDASSINGPNIQQHAIEHVEELDGQLAAEPLAKEKPLAERDIFIQVSRRTDSIIEGSRVSNGPVARRSKGRGIDEWLPFVVVVPVETEIGRHKVRPVGHEDVAN